MVWSANKNACRHRHVNQFTSIKWGIVPSVNQHLNFLLPHFQTINCFSSDLIERLVKLRERCNQNHQFDSVLFANWGLFWSNPANLYKQSISRQGKKEGSSDFKCCRWCSFGPQQVRALKEPNLPAADQPIICLWKWEPVVWITVNVFRLELINILACWVDFWIIYRMHLEKRDHSINGTFSGLFSDRIFSSVNIWTGRNWASCDFSF